MSDRKKDIWYKSGKPPGPEAMQRYLAGKMLPDELRAFEKHLAEEELYQDALEGMKMSSTQEWGEGMKQFDAKWKAALKPEEDEKSVFWYYAAAAVVTGVFVFAGMYYLNKDKEVMAYEAKPQDEQVTQTEGMAITEEPTETMEQKSRVDEPMVSAPPILKSLDKETMTNTGPVNPILKNDGVDFGDDVVLDEIETLAPVTGTVTNNYNSAGTPIRSKTTTTTDEVYEDNILYSITSPVAPNYTADMWGVMDTSITLAMLTEEDTKKKQAVNKDADEKKNCNNCPKLTVPADMEQVNESRFAKAKALYDQGKYADAEPWWKAASDQPDADDATRNYYVATLLRLYKYQEALKVLQAQPLSAVAAQREVQQWQKAAALLGLGRMDEAKAILKELTKSKTAIGTAAAKKLKVIQ